MPNDLPPWHALFGQAQHWLWTGCFEMPVHDLRAVLRLAEGRSEPSAAVLGSRAVVILLLRRAAELVAGG
jgi:hypothetical protein